MGAVGMVQVFADTLRRVSGSIKRATRGIMQFSVVICTFNRLPHLLASVESVFGQSLPTEHFEVIVVDNCSTDGTAQAVQALMKGQPSLRYLYETRVGLAHARNTGWQSAQGKYVAFLDDDARSDPRWLETARALLDQNAELVHCIGGPIYPFYTSPKPHWWLDSYEIRTRGDAQRPLKNGEFFSGSNMIWKKTSLEAYGGFEANAGMKGNQLGMGEETGLFRRIWAAELTPLFMYSPDLRVSHWVPPEKMTMRYIVKRAAAAGQFEADYLLKQAPTFKGRLVSIRSTLGWLGREVPGVLLKRRHYRTTQNWYFEHCFIPIQNVSKLLRLMGFKFTVNQRSE
jgi:glycosyltransferase involved in cell wall biosynthesis